MNDFSLFTTLRIDAGHCALLSIHLDHMAESAAVLGFAMDRAALEEAIVQAATRVSAAAAKIRVNLTEDGTWNVSEPEMLFADAPHLQALLWPEPTDSRDPLFVHKTTPRPVYDQVARQVHACGFVDAIFHNEHGLVTEGAVHSVFARFGEVWKTPQLSAGVLPGVFREHLLQTTPAAREENFSVEDLLQADEVWLTNALRGIRRVDVIQQ